MLDVDFNTAKQLWLDALRSGKYEQGTFNLHLIKSDYHRQKPGYCCLGVVCSELELKETLLGQDSSHTVVAFGEFGNTALPPREVIDFFNLKKLVEYKINGTLTNESLINVLTYMNDTERLSFDSIADYIEKNVTEKELTSEHQSNI